MDYQTITTIARLTRRNERLRQRLGKLVEHLKSGNAKRYDGPFPARRLLEVLDRLEAEVDANLVVTHDVIPEFCLAEEHPGWVGHAARYMIRSSLWERLAVRAAKGKRSDFNDLQLIDIKATTETIRAITEGGIRKRTMEMLVTGAIPTWQRCAKYKHPPVKGFEAPTTAACPFCRGGAVEDMNHILWECKCWEEERKEMRKELVKEGVKEEELPKITREQGVIFEDHQLLRWRRDGVVKEWAYEDRPLPAWKEEEGQEAVTTEEGRRVVYTDGSCLGQSEERVRSAGCGIFVAARHSWNQGFRLPGVVQSSEVAEARAAVHVLEAATDQDFDVEVRLDNKSVVETLTAIGEGGEVEFEKGRHLWRRATAAMRRRKEEGGAGHRVTWVPGHTDSIDVLAGRITEVDRRGNVNVDAMAKEGAAVAACPVDLVEKAAKRKKAGKVLHNGFAEILMKRRTTLQEWAAVWEEEEEEPDDPWAEQRPRVNRLGLRSKKKEEKKEEEQKEEEPKEEEEEKKKKEAQKWRRARERMMGRVGTVVDDSVNDCNNSGEVSDGAVAVVLNVYNVV